MNTTRTLTLAGLALAALAGAPPLPAQNAPPPPAAPPADGGLRFNFRGAPLETVLQYLSEAAGLIIVLETPVRGTIDMWSAQPVSRREAVHLLNLALNKNGLTATLQDRTLVVSSRDEAKKRNLPVRTGNDPAEIPANAEMVMQIIPLRQITAARVASDIATLIPPSATLTANEDSNSLVVTDTNLNVRHIVEIVAALDSAIQSDASLRIFRLENADPQEMANLLNALFATTQGTTGGGTQQVAAGFPGMPPGLAAAIAARTGGQGGRGNRSGSNSRPSGTTTPVNAVADPRTQSVIVTAPKDTLGQIGEIVAQLDTSTARKQKVFVYTLENADVQQVESVLRDLFQTTGARTSSSNQADPLASRAASNNQQTGGNFMNNTGGPR